VFSVIFVVKKHDKKRRNHMALKITIEVWRKGKWFVAKCPELDFASQGKTHDEAKKNQTTNYEEKNYRLIE